MQSTILVATASQGILRSADDGESWHRIGLRQAIEFDGIVRSLDTEPGEPCSILAGTSVGLCRSRDIGSSWSLVDTPFNGETIWKVAVDPNDAKRIFVGTGAPSRAALWRTTDGGLHWTRANLDIPEFCAGVNRPRLLAFAYNPKDRLKAWFGLEAGGLFRTSDGGDHWERIDDRLLWDYHTDIHAIHVLPDAEQTVVVICVNAVYTSRDGGESWQGMLPKAGFGLYYARALATPPDSKDTLYLSLSDGTPGTTSAIVISRDGARTWQPTVFDDAPDSCIWGIRVNAGHPSHLVAGTKYGMLYLSRDEGRHWSRQWRSFPEITDVLWVPYAAHVEAAHRSEVA